MQPVPGVYLDVAVLLVFTGVGRIRCWPGARLVAAEPGAVAAGTPAPPWLVGRRGGGELTVRAGNHHRPGISPTEPARETRRGHARVHTTQVGGMRRVDA